jgi:hypothetical protein
MENSPNADPESTLNVPIEILRRSAEFAPIVNQDRRIPIVNSETDRRFG